MKTTLLLLAVTSTLIPASVRAEEGGSSDSLAAGGAEEHKLGAIEVTPLGLFVGHYGAQLELVPVPHHGLVMSAYYAHVESGDAQFVQLDDKHPAPVPTNRYSGVGGELGYRYYFGRLGPHGLYLGPSLIVGSYSADYAGTTADARTSTSYHNLGGALDIGYQAYVGPVLFGLSAGAQYVYVDQQLPYSGDLFTEVSTRSALRPRAAVTFGYAF